MIDLFSRLLSGMGFDATQKVRGVKKPKIVKIGKKAFLVISSDEIEDALIKSFQAGKREGEKRDK
jgi:hypothetical protein